jgi:ParB/RepB/Spo0J family partition protein
MQDVPLALIDPAPHLARPVDNGEYMADLKDSMRSLGQIDPVIIVRMGKRYVIVDGMHRLTAAREMGWTHLRAQIFPDKKTAIEAIQLHTCMVHKEMTAWEEHLFYVNLCDRLGLSFEDACVYTRRSEAYVSLRLCLGNLTAETKTALQNNRITLSAAQQLLRVKDAMWERYFLNQALLNGCGAKVLQTWITQWQLNAKPLTEETLNEAMAKPAPPPPPMEYICGLCGKPSQGRMLVQVWVHADELEPLAQAIAAQARASAGAPGAGAPKEG